MTKINSWVIYKHILKLVNESDIEEKTYLWANYFLTYFYHEFKEYDIFMYEKIYLNRMGLCFTNVKHNLNLIYHVYLLSDKINSNIYNDLEKINIDIEYRINRLFNKLKCKKCYELSMGVHSRKGYWYSKMKKYISKGKWKDEKFTEDTKRGYIEFEYSEFIKEKMICV